MLIIEELGKPKQLYSHEESSLRSQGFSGCINENDIKTIQTSTHAHTVERLTSTFKDNLYLRLDAVDHEKSEWVKHVKNIVGKYNNTTHSTIEIKPVGGAKKENHLCVSWHLWNSAKRGRKY